MTFPTSVANKLLDNVFKGVQWDTPNASFGYVNARLSSTPVNPNGTGVTLITGTGVIANQTITSAQWSAAAGGATTLSTGPGTLLDTTAPSTSVGSVLIYEGAAGATSTLRAFFNLSRQHVLGDTFSLNSGKLSISLG